MYGVVGDSLNPIVDAIRRTTGIDWVHVHNEEAGAFAASAEAQVTGRLAVCAGSSGPGNTHLIQGLYDANRSGAPVLAIASHIPTSQIGTSYFQETRPESLFMDASVWCQTLTGADQMPRMLRIADPEALAKQRRLGARHPRRRRRPRDDPSDRCRHVQRRTGTRHATPGAGPTTRRRDQRRRDRHPVLRRRRSRQPTAT